MGWKHTDTRREELYEEVLAEPVTKVAKRYALPTLDCGKYAWTSKCRSHRSATGQNWLQAGPWEATAWHDEGTNDLSAF